MTSVLRGRWVPVVAGGLCTVAGLALAWPDVTLLVVAVVFGARTVLFGLSLVAGSLRPAPTASPDGPARRSPLRRWTRVVVVWTADRFAGRPATPTCPAG